MKNVDVYKNIRVLDDEKYKRCLTVRKSMLPQIDTALKAVKLDPWAINYSRPLMLVCETVNTCTNDCIICAYGRMTRKKMTMPLELFEKVLRDYSDMGGGCLSLTPKAGEVFCDELLPRRLEIVRNYPAIKALSVTTNAVLADRYGDAELERILAGFNKVQVSVYGMDEEEYRQMAGRSHYSRVVGNIDRMLRLADSKKTRINLGLRLLKPRAEEDIEEWIRNNFGADVPYGYTYTYMDWNGALDDGRPLPFGGKWRDRTVNEGPCVIPMATCLIFSNGNVTLCPCNDFNMRKELNLGNISEKPLIRMLNSKKARDFWALKPEYAGVCRHCGSHRSFSDIKKYEYMFDDPLSFIGA